MDPASIFPYLAKLTHGADQVSKGGMLEMVNIYWHVPEFLIFATHFCSKYVTCLQLNTDKVPNILQSAHLTHDAPFEHLLMELIEFTPAQ